MTRVRALPLALIVTLAACDSAVQPLTPGLSVVSGDRVTDTIQSTPPQPLIVRVIGEQGEPLVGVEVAFAGGAFGGPGRYHTLAGPSPRPTDRDGFVSAIIYLGTVAGEDSVTVTVPSLGLAAIARYTVRPGHAVGVAIDPPDTAVYVGGTVQLRGSVVDRGRNPVDGPVTYQTASAAAHLSGTTLTGVEVGRASVVGASGTFRDTSWVSVVPQGSAVAVLPHMVSNDTQRVVFFNFDGTGIHSFDVNYWATPRPDWSPAGDVIALEDPGPFPGFNPRLILGDLSGPKQRLVPDSVGLVSESDPRYSADGSWIYFAGARPGARPDIWRVRPDGTGAERLSGFSDYYYGAYQPSPSPDGSRVAFTRNAVCCYDLLVYVLNTSTGAIDSLMHPDGTPTPGYMRESKIGRA